MPATTLKKELKLFGQSIVIAAELKEKLYFTLELQQYVLSFVANAPLLAVSSIEELLEPNIVARVQADIDQLEYILLEEFSPELPAHELAARVQLSYRRQVPDLVISKC